MSFILDALKKAEHARPPASMPQMPAAPVAATGLEKRRQPPAWVLAGGGAVATLVVVGLAWRFLGNAATMPPEATTAPSRPLAAAPAIEAAGSVAGAPLAEAVEPRRAEVRPLDSEARAGQPEPVPIAPSSRMTSSVPRSTGSSGRVTGGSVIYEDLSTEPPVQRGGVQYQRNFANEPAPATGLAPAAAPDPAPAAPAPATDSGTALYNNLKLTGDGLPNLHMDIHVFSEDAGNRFIFINSRKYREGQTTREGVLIEEITPTGATMSYRGERFSMARN